MTKFLQKKTCILLIFIAIIVLVYFLFFFRQPFFLALFASISPLLFNVAYQSYRAAVVAWVVVFGLNQ